MSIRALSIKTAALVGALALAGMGAAHADESPGASTDAIADAVAAVTAPEVAGSETAASAKPDGSFASKGAGVDVAMPSTATGDAIAVAETASGKVSVGVGLGADDSASGSLAADGSVVYSGGGGSTDATVQPTDDGMRIHTVIADASAPTQFAHEVTLSPGLRLVMMSDIPGADSDGATSQQASAPSGVAILDAQDHLVGGFASPWAKDANGTNLPTRYAIRDGNLVQFVDHASHDVAYPVVADPFLGFDLISSASWAHHSEGWTLEVTPTGWARANAGGYIVGSYGWDELYSKYKNTGLDANLDGMRDQYICHQQIVAIRSPKKATWNLDEWRPNVSYLETVNARCNPGGDKVFD